MHKHDKHRGEPGQRQLRVGEELRHGLARIIERQELHDPALQERSVTVTEVRMSPDLKTATVFIMPLGGAESELVLAGLRRGAAFLRGRLAREVPLRFTPSLSFALDTSFDHANRINQLLHRPEVERDLAAEAGDDARAGGDGDGNENGASPGGAGRDGA